MVHRRRFQKIIFFYRLTRLISVSTFLFIFSFSAYSVSASEITLAWDPNPERDIVGYKIYYGSSSRCYTNEVDIGNCTSCTISGLDDGRTYYITATAYDTEGNESNYSAEIAYKSHGISNGGDSETATACNTEGNESNYSAEIAHNSDGVSNGEDSGGGCFIVTANYGNSMASATIIPRNFRDKYLITNCIGRTSVKFVTQNHHQLLFKEWNVRQWGYCERGHRHR